MSFRALGAALDRFIETLIPPAHVHYHTWRPAVVGSRIGRFCDGCDAKEPLSDESFYAEFGKMPQEYVGIFK